MPSIICRLHARPGWGNGREAAIRPNKHRCTGKNRPLGGKNWRIAVDDDTTPVGAEYFAGPAVQKNPPLLDGGGTHLYILGVFLTPLGLGPHSITIDGELDGAALGGSPFTEHLAYTVMVVP
jgi:hypothetical protein